VFNWPYSKSISFVFHGLIVVLLLFSAFVEVDEVSMGFAWRPVPAPALFQEHIHHKQQAKVRPFLLSRFIVRLHALLRECSPHKWQ